jgi:DNA-directed RNA polymerase specialized sigma24 family protein
MEKVGKRGQRIVQLRLQGMTYDEIAEETDLSVITVRRLLSSVLTALAR